MRYFIALAAFVLISGCGQPRSTTPITDDSDADGQVVPNSDPAQPEDEPVDNTDTTDASDPTGDDSDSSDPIETDPTNPEDATNPGDPTDDSEPGDASETDLADPTEATDLTDPSQTDEPTDETDPTNSDDDPADAETTETPPPGTYSYERLPLGGFDTAIRAAFHPSGDYALIISQYDTLHIYDWSTQTATAIELDTNQDLLLTDVVFKEDGSCAWITATDISGDPQGLILRFDDTLYRAQIESSDLSDVVTDFTSSITGQYAKAIALPWDGSAPVALFQSGESGFYIWSLRAFNAETGAFEGLYTSTTAGSPGEDLTFVNNEFGTWGILVVGGSSGADTHYYTELSNVGEWRSGPGNNNIGNANRVEAYPGGDYALVISGSGRAIYRFETGELGSYNDALRFSSLGIWNIKFQQEGQRALISGRASLSGSMGTMLEYRHDLFECSADSTDCGETAINNVSIPGFDAAPWQATSNSYIFDTAFRPGCDGGILVGGYGGTSSSGFLGEFQIENGVSCRTED